MFSCILTDVVIFFCSPLIFMKIGVLTYHRAENYGALLQAYATKTYLQGLGHEVSFVDYWPKYHSDYFRVFPFEKFKKGNIRVKFGLLWRETLWSIFRAIRKKQARPEMRLLPRRSSRLLRTRRQASSPTWTTTSTPRMPSLTCLNL